MLRRTNSLRKPLRFRHIWAEFTRGAQHWHSLLTNVNTPFFHTRCRIRARCCGAGGPSRRLGLCIRCSLLCLRGVTVYSHISDTQGVNTTTLVQMCTVPWKGCERKLYMYPLRSYNHGISTWKAKPSPRDFYHANPSSSLCFFKTKGLFTCLGREEDPSTRKILEGGSSLRHMFSVHVFGLHAKGCSCPQR